MTATIQRAIEAFNVPLKASVHTTGWWKINPRESFFKKHIASRVVAATTLIFAEALSILGHTAQLLKDIFLSSVATGVRVFRNATLNHWSDAQPNRRHIFADIKKLAATVLYAPFSPVVGFISPLGNYNLQVKFGFIPVSPSIQLEQDRIIANNALPKAIESEISQNEILTKALRAIYKNANGDEIDPDTIGTSKLAIESWKVQLKNHLNMSGDQRFSALNLLLDEIDSSNDNLQKQISNYIKTQEDQVSKFKSKNKHLKKTNLTLVANNTNLENKLKALEIISAAHSEDISKKEKRKSFKLPSFSSKTKTEEVKEEKVETKVEVKAEEKQTPAEKKKSRFSFRKPKTTQEVAKPEVALATGTDKA